MHHTITWPRIILRIFLFVVVSGMFLFVPAGTVNWPEAMLFIAVYILCDIPLIIWLKKHNPELLLKRLDWKHLLPTRWERIIFVFLTIFMFAIFVVAGLDVRFGWSHVPLPLKVLGFLFFLPGFTLLYKVMKVNTFLARVVEIQKGHRVITTGPYKYVRHPMYLGAAFLILPLPLAFGSYYALIPSALTLFCLIIRIIFEERMLKKELEGYKEYMQGTRYRLIPGIW